MTERLQPNNHTAFGAIDEGQRAYVVLDPNNPNDGRLERLAIPLKTGTLVHAEEHARAFNAGETWAFKTDTVLRGAAIPPLHRA